jgi:hypothetical protein
MQGTINYGQGIKFEYHYHSEQQGLISNLRLTIPNKK